MPCAFGRREVAPSEVLPKLGLTGKGEIIAITDTGLDTGESETIHLDFRGRIKLIKSYPIQSSLSPYVLNPGDDDLEELFEDAYDQGARIHSNSWGGGEPGIYDERCKDLDRFVLMSQMV